MVDDDDSRNADLAPPDTREGQAPAVSEEDPPRLWTRPSWEEPKFDPNSWEDPDWEHPDHKSPTWTKPSWEQPEHAPVAIASPSWKAPEWKSPSHEEPKWSAPKWEQPTHAKPEWNRPDHNAPTWLRPSFYAVYDGQRVGTEDTDKPDVSTSADDSSPPREAPELEGRIEAIGADTDTE